MNEFIITGRFTKNIELQTAENGTSYARCSIAVDDGYGEKKKTYFLPFVLFNDMAMNASKYCSKGSIIGIKGKIIMENYTDRQGNKRETMGLHVTNLTFLDTKKNDNPAVPKKDEEKIDLDDYSSQLPF